MKLKSPIIGSSIYLDNIEGGLENYTRWVNDPIVNKYLEVRNSPPNIDDIKVYVDKMFESNNSLLLGIFLNNKKHIGNIKIAPIDWVNRRGDLGFFIGDSDLWGKGIGREAINLATNFSFNDLGLHKMSAGCHSKNIGSMVALLKSGYKIEGLSRDHWLIKTGLWDDNISFSKISKG